MPNRPPKPPIAANAFLEWYCRPELAEEIQGDLDQAWQEDFDSKGRLRAGLIYWLEVLLFIRAHTIRRRDPYTARGSIMWKNYAKVAVRSMRRQISYSAINLLGLAVGLACTFLILVYVADERSFDQYHADADRIYRMTAGASGEYDGIAKVNGAWGVTAAREIPGIESLTRVMFFGQTRFRLEDRQEYVYGGFYADSTTFDVFSWEMLLGDPDTALIEPNSMVMTQSLAETWFPGQDPRGQTVLLDETVEYTITGVIQDVPDNSHFTFPFLASMSSYTGERHDDWVTWNQYYTYLKLNAGVDPAHVSAAATDMVAANVDAEAASSFGMVGMQPLTDIYLRSNMFREISVTGNERSVTVFGLLAVFILLIAAVNFINLSTARSSLRSREVGVRKSLGAKRGVLIRQFLSESVLTVFIAAIIAIGLIALYLPTFNTMSGKAFEFGGFLSGGVLLASLAVLLTVGIAAGVYPSFVLSSFNPVRVMKGVTTSPGGAGLRKSLVTLQFVISGALIMGTGIVSDQLQYIQDRPLGFESDHIVGVPIQDNSLRSQYDAIRDEMAGLPGVEEIAISANRPGGGDYGIPIQIPGLTSVEVPSSRMLVADFGYLDVYKMELAQGRDFDRDRPADEENGLLVNEAFVRQLGWDDPIGQEVTMTAVGREFEIIGVMKDFHYRSLHEAIGPLILFAAPEEWYSMLNVRINPALTTETLDEMAEIYERYDVNNVFSYSFMDQRLNSLYAADQRVEALLQRFTFLAIIIACLGLFGLAAFTAERRKAEIGVRKVIGASEFGIIMLLTKETAILVGISLLIAAPGVIYLGRSWLESFAYSGGISSSGILIGSLIALTLGVVTTGFQAWRAARLDPVKAIRTD